MVHHDQDCLSRPVGKDVTNQNTAKLAMNIGHRICPFQSRSTQLSTVPFDRRHLCLIMCDRRTLGPLGFLQFFHHTAQRLHNVLGWYRLVARSITHAQATSITNPEVNWNTVYYTPSNHMQQSENNGFRIIGTMCFCCYQSQLSFREWKPLVCSVMQPSSVHSLI